MLLFQAVFSVGFYGCLRLILLSISGHDLTELGLIITEYYTERNAGKFERRKVFHNQWMLLQQVDGYRNSKTDSNNRS